MTISESALMQVLRLLEKSESLNVSIDIGDATVRAARGHSASIVAPTTLRVSPERSTMSNSKPTAASAPPVDDHVVGQLGQPDDGAHVVSAATTGTFYRSPSPGAPPFCEPGDQVGPEQTIGLVEVMKLFNSVPAGKGGVLVKFLAADGQQVTRGQALALVKEPA